MIGPRRRRRPDVALHTGWRFNSGRNRKTEGRDSCQKRFQFGNKPAQANGTMHCPCANSESHVSSPNPPRLLVKSPCKVTWATGKTWTNLVKAKPVS